MAVRKKDERVMTHHLTFIDLGADRCIPCKAMQSIMKEIAETYSDRVQVVFYDVWKDPEPARKYEIQIIPTQAFVDQKGNDVYRHVGLFPEKARQALGATIEGAARAYFHSGLSVGDVMDLVPVRPLKDDEEDIKLKFRLRLKPLYEKIKP